MSGAVTAAVEPRTVHVEHCMGTVFTIDIRDAGDWSSAIADVAAWLHWVDAVFSTYKPGSTISRIRRGELHVSDAHPEVGEVLDLCAQIQVRTGNAFTAMPDGRLDPTGLVKGWAIERASVLLREHGSSNHAINGGGDMHLAGGPAPLTEPGRPWTVGITDPHDRTRVLTTVSDRDIAVATSGVAERGAHIVDPFTGKPVRGMASATVIGPSLTFADSYATAAFVLGKQAPRWIDNLDGYAALLVDADREQFTSHRWPTS